MKKFGKFAALVGLCAVVLLTGCAGGGTALDNQQTNPQRVMQGIGTANMPNSMTFDRQKAENIEKRLEAMNEISEADVVVYGNTALVAYRPAGNAGGSNTGNAADNRNNTANDFVGNMNQGVIGNNDNMGVTDGRTGNLTNSGNMTDNRFTGNNAASGDAESRIKTEVMNADKSITNVVCTQNTEYVERIKNLRRQITDNNAGNDIIDEFNRIVQSIMPVP